MRINSDQIDSHTRQRLAPFYWVAGDETLLVQECLSLIRQRCREAGFTEWELFFVDRSFDWHTMLQAGNSMSLFADRKIIELRVSGKLEDEGKATLKRYLDSPNPDNVLLLVTPKLEPATLNTQWFKALEASGVFITVWPVTPDKLGHWIQARLKQNGMTADHDTLSVLTDRVEGNLLAADQEIQKLRVLTGATQSAPVHLDRRQVMTLVADSARYTTFALIDAALLGEARRCVKVLAGLKAEGAELLQILGALTSELRRLNAIAEHRAAGRSLTDAMTREGVRRLQEKPVSAALQRLSGPQLQAMLQRARRIDMAVKGLAEADPWIELSQLLLALSGYPLMPIEMQR